MSELRNQWIKQLREWRGFNRAMVTAANKNARIIWACFEWANRSTLPSEDVSGVYETSEKIDAQVGPAR